MLHVFETCQTSKCKRCFFVHPGCVFKHWLSFGWLSNENTRKIQPVDHYLTVFEQVLFVYVSTLIPPRLMDQRNFITVLIVTREPEQTLLFRSAACGVTPHGLHTADRRQPPVRAIFKSVFSPNILTACLTYSLFTWSFLRTKPCVIYSGILEC